MRETVNKENGLLDTELVLGKRDHERLHFFAEPTPVYLDHTEDAIPTQTFKPDIINGEQPFQSIHMKLPRFGTVEAMMCALEFLATGKVFVEKRYFFELLVVAQWLQVEKLIVLCSQRISSSLSLKTIIPACHFAFRCNFSDLLMECYRWLLVYFIEPGNFSLLLTDYFSKFPPLPYNEIALTYGFYSVPLSAFLLCYGEQPQLTQYYE